MGKALIDGCAVLFLLIRRKDVSQLGGGQREQAPQTVSVLAAR